MEYANGALDLKNVTNVYNEERSGRPIIVTNELVAKIEEKIQENRQLTIM